MLIQADALYLPYPSNYFHAIVTSPPYWGLRKYAGEQGRAWGGDPDCEHEWVDQKYYTMRGASSASSDAFSEAGEKNSERLKKARWRQDSTCSKCNAWYGGLGLEPTPELHIQNMVEIFREVWRVLRSDGVVFLNYGDCFAGSGGENANTGLTAGKHRYRMTDDKTRSNLYRNNPRKEKLAQGNLMLMPHRLAIALQADGWIVRNDLVWWKRNPMPESVAGWRWEAGKPCGCATKAREKYLADVMEEKGMERHRAFYEDGGHNKNWADPDCPKCHGTGKVGDPVLRKSSWRHTRAHEYIFQLVKGMQYFCDQEVVRETLARPEELERDTPAVFGGASKHAGFGTRKASGNPYIHSSGRNPRSVLDVPTAPYKGAHYATFPPKLIAPLIRASVPRRCCPECGMAWAPVVNKTTSWESNAGKAATRSGNFTLDDSGHPRSDIGRPDHDVRYGPTVHSTVTAYRPSCECGHEEHEPGIVLDIFGGSGTTGMVAKQLLRRWVVMDISRPYLDEQAKIRTGSGTPANALDGLPMFEEME